MVTIETNSLAIASIFRYPNPIDRSSIEQWAESNGWELVDGEITLGPGGQSIAAQTPLIGNKDRFALAFNPKTELRHYGQSAFVTVKDEEGGKSAELVTIANDLRTLFDDKSILDQVDSYEVTLECRVRVSQDHDISLLASEEKANELGEIHNSSANLSAIRLTSEKVDDQDTYFYLLIDTDTDNPAWWQAKYVRRYELDNYSKSEMLEDLREVIDVTNTQS